MKVIKLNESQYRRLFEISSTVASLGVNANPDSNPPTNINNQEEVSNSAVPGEAGTSADEFQATQAPHYGKDGGWIRY